MKCQCEHESHDCQEEAVKTRSTPYGNYELCEECYRLHMNLTYIREQGQGDWSIDDGLDGFHRYSQLGGYEAKELDFGGILGDKGDGKVTVLSYWNGMDPLKTFWREQAIHEATGVQVGYLYYEE